MLSILDHWVKGIIGLNQLHLLLCIRWPLLQKFCGTARALAGAVVVIRGGLKTRTAILLIVLSVQGKWVAQVLSGKASLPDEATMMKEIGASYQLLADYRVPVRYYHCQVILLCSQCNSHSSRCISKLPFILTGHSWLSEPGCDTFNRCICSPGEVGCRAVTLQVSFHTKRAGTM